MSARFCLLSSTGGAVVRRVWQEDRRFRDDLSLVITDRHCGAADFATENCIPHVMLQERDGLVFSNKLAALLRECRLDYTFCFFTRLLRGSICKEFGDRIFNFHPSLLPANPGMHGFEDSVASGALFIGSTVHVINELMDAGKIVMQSAVSSRATSGDLKALRHQIYKQQCAQLLQVFLWARAGRLSMNAQGVEVRGADYIGAELCVPAIEDDASRRLASGMSA